MAITVPCGREVTSEVLRGTVLLSVDVNDLEKVPNKVKINFANYTKVCKAAKQKASWEELQEGLRRP